MAKPFIIAIDGNGCAGKSTLADALAAQLDSCVVIGIDDFCYPPSGRPDEWWGKNVPDHGVDWRRLEKQVIKPAFAGNSVRYEALDWDDYALKWMPEIRIGKFLIIEGAKILRRELRGYFDLKIWLDSPDETRLDRVAARDGQKMVTHWVREFLPSVEQYMNDHQPRQAADLILKTGDGPGAILARIYASAG